MKKSNGKLKIDQPCHADWSKMIPEEQGKFCQSCEKVVVDFSWMSDTQILRTMDEMVNQSVCGRFESDQLHRELNQSTEIYDGSFHLKSILMGAAFSTLISLSVYSQNTTVNTINEPVLSPLCISDTIQEKWMGDAVMIYQHPLNGEEKTELKGTVLSLAKSPIRNASVNVMDGNGQLIQSIKTNEQGVFQTMLDWSKKPSYMIVFYGTTESRSFEFHLYKELNRFQILLPIQDHIKGKVLKD